MSSLVSPEPFPASQIGNRLCLNHEMDPTAMPFAASIGVEITSAAADEVSGRVEWSPERCTAGGVLHGGAVMSLADALGAACAYLNLPPGAATSTIESKTNFFRALRGGALTGTARPLHVGGTTIVVQTDLRDEEGRRVALTTQTQAVIAGAS
jgi:1,4-dihydroxy-2-naphthoyl-CoA hydrolase